MSPLKTNTGNLIIIRLLQKHIIYLCGLILFTFLIFSFIPFQLKKYVDAKKSVKRLDENLNQLTIKRSTIIQYSKRNIDQQLSIINTLLPNTEDKFSIFNAIDNLQFVYGMLIERYSSPYAASGDKFITISVLAQAEESQFQDFLKNYYYLSGRYISIDAITYVPGSRSLSFTATFYTYNPQWSPNMQLSFQRKIVDDSQKIEQSLSARNPFFKKVELNEQDVSVEYTPKTNPFQ